MRTEQPMLAGGPPTSQPGATKPGATRLPYMSRDEVEALIAEGRKIILVDDYVLKVDAWIKYHPGGEISILHLVGRDGTDEVKA